MKQIGIFALGSALLFSLLSSGTAAEQTLVRPEFIRRIGAISTVQPIFNGNVNGSDYGAANALIRELNLNGARAFLWPQLQYPHTPWAASQFGRTPIPREQVAEARRKWFAQDFAKTVPAAFKNRKGEWSSAQFYQLQIFKNIHLTENIVFHSQLDAGARLYPDRVNAYYSAYIQAIRTFAPWIRQFWIQHTNEPNYPWWSGEFETTGESVKAWIDVYNSLNRHLRKNHPGVQLLGPVLAASSTFNWHDFQQWTKPVLAGTEIPLEFYNYHLYNIGAWSHLAWISMFQAEAERIGRIRPRAYISETAYALGKSGVDGDLIRWTAQQLFTALENPDKIHALSWHMLVFDWFNYTNILFKDRARKSYTPGANFHLYRTLRNLRGTTVYTVPSANPALRKAAAMPDASHLTLALFNDGEEPVELQMHVPFPVVPDSLTVQSVRPTGRGTYQYSIEKAETSGADRTLRLAPGEVRSLEWSFPKPLPPPKRTLVQREFYAPVVGEFFSDTITGKIRLPASPAPAEQCFLRFGIYTDDKLSAEGGVLHFNGTRFPLRWNQARADVEMSDHSWFFEIPLSPGLVQRENEFSLHVEDTDYKLMFASIVTREEPDAASAEKAAKEAIAWRSSELSGSLRAPARLTDGETGTYRLKLENNTGKTLSIGMQITFPDGIVSTGSLQGTHTLSPGGVKLLEYKVRAVSNGSADPRETIVRLHAPGMRSKELRSTVTIYPIHRAAYSPETPSKESWEAIRGIPFRQGNISGETKLLWNERYLFYQVRAEGPFKPAAPATIDSFFSKDVLEFFLDLSNTKPSQYDPAFCAQLFCCPAGAGSDQNVLCGSVLRARRGDNVDVIGRRKEPEWKASVSFPEKGGYLVSGAIPWKIIQKNFRPASGRKIGFDLAVSHPGTRQTTTFSCSVLGLKQKQHWSPKGWGVLLLE